MPKIIAGLFLWVFMTLAIGPAAVRAQATGSDRNSNVNEALRDLDRQNNESRSRLGAAQSDAEKTVQQVTDAIARRDCAAAVVTLNVGLGKRYLEVVTLAGALYEEGLCVKQNWDRAVGLYQRAANAGHPGVAARLAAGYASVAGGRDKAASVWWAVRAGTAAPPVCKPTAPADNPDRFVAALEGWPAGQLDACAYVAAVMATLQAEAEGEGASLATAFGLVGRIRVVFIPRQDSIDIIDELTEGALTSVLSVDSVALQSERRTARKNFLMGLRLRADLALKRFEKPGALPADWRVEATFEIRPTRP